MAKQTSNNDIINAIGELGVEFGSLKGDISGINSRLDKLNGATAKNIDKLAAQDILNAQQALIHQAILNDITELKEDKKSMSKFWYGVISSVGVGLLWLLINSIK